MQSIYSKTWNIEWSIWIFGQSVQNIDRAYTLDRISSLNFVWTICTDHAHRTATAEWVAPISSFAWSNIQWSNDRWKSLKVLKIALADHSLLYTMFVSCVQTSNHIIKVWLGLKKTGCVKTKWKFTMQFSIFKVGSFESLSDMCLINTPSPAHAPWQSHQINSLYKRLSLVLAKLFVHTSGLPSDPS
jgi:hypothetical protein